MNGQDYRAVRRLSDRSGKTEFAAVGETCERVPESSLPWLLANGLIEPVTAAPATEQKKRKGVASAEV